MLVPKRILTCSYQKYSWKITGVIDPKLSAGYLSEFWLVHITSIGEKWLVFRILRHLLDTEVCFNLKIEEGWLIFFWSKSNIKCGAQGVKDSEQGWKAKAESMGGEPKAESKGGERKQSVNVESRTGEQGWRAKQDDQGSFSAVLPTPHPVVCFLPLYWSFFGFFLIFFSNKKYLRQSSVQFFF